MLKRVVGAALYVLACVLMAASLLVLLLAASLLSAQVAVALRVAPVALAVTQALPAWFAFWGVLASPLGGVFRTDLVILALVLFIVSKLLRKIARVL